MIRFQLRTDSELIRQAFEASLMCCCSDEEDLSENLVRFTLMKQPFIPDLLPRKLIKYLGMGNRIVEKSLYITKYENAALLVTDLIRQQTSGYFNFEILPIDNVDIQSLMFYIKDHMTRHLIYHGLLVLHAGAVVDKWNRIFMVLGSTGQGKSSFIMNAFHSGNYQIVADDRCIINMKRGRLYTNRQRVRLLNNDCMQFRDYVEDKVELRNRGEEKYSILLRTQEAGDGWLSFQKSNLYLVWLAGVSEEETRIKIGLSDDYLDPLFDTTQEGIYVFYESMMENATKKLLMGLPLLQIIRHPQEHVFGIFEQNKHDLIQQLRG